MSNGIFAAKMGRQSGMYPSITYIMVCVGILFIGWLKERQPYESKHRREREKLKKLQDKMIFVTRSGEEIDIYEFQRRQAEFYRTGRNLF